MARELELKTPGILELRDIIKDAVEELENDPEMGVADEDGIRWNEITLAADHTGWAVQLGDNSFTGSAYGYRNWSVGWYCTQMTNYDQEYLAIELIAELEELQ